MLECLNGFREKLQLFENGMLKKKRKGKNEKHLLIDNCIVYKVNKNKKYKN